MDACGCDGFTEIFDARTARHDLARYRRRGPDDTTRLLLDMLRAAGVRGRTLLDIGAGIGVITHELLRDGVEPGVRGHDDLLARGAVRPGRDLAAAAELPADELAASHGSSDAVVLRLRGARSSWPARSGHSKPAHGS